jgi:hypothetical protein
MKPDNVSGSNQEICWFCKKGRHSECMKNIPIDIKSEEPYDCSFNTNMITCKCNH